MKEFYVDLEIAKVLKANRFPQINGQYYAKVNKDILEFKEEIEIEPTKWIEEFCSVDTQEELDYQQLILFPTSDEILKELPHEINGFILEIIRYEDGTFEADYARSLWRDEDTEYLIKSKKLFYKLNSCLAELWIDLKKEGYIK